MKNNEAGVMFFESKDDMMDGFVHAISKFSPSEKESFREKIKEAGVIGICDCECKKNRETRPTFKSKLKDNAFVISGSVDQISKELYNKLGVVKSPEDLVFELELSDSDSDSDSENDINEVEERKEEPMEINVNVNGEVNVNVNVNMNGLDRDCDSEERFHLSDLFNDEFDEFDESLGDYLDNLVSDVEEDEFDTQVVRGIMGIIDRFNTGVTLRKYMVMQNGTKQVLTAEIQHFLKALGIEGTASFLETVDEEGYRHTLVRVTWEHSGYTHELSVENN